MKRGMYLLVLVILIPVVSAVDVTLAGFTFSLTTFLPIIIVVLAVLFFFLLWLKDNYSTILEKLFNVPKFGYHKIKKALEQPAVDYLKEIDKFEKKMPNLTIDDAFKQLNGIVKEFFSYTFKIEKEYTHTELESILMRHRKNTFIPFSNKLAEMKYTNKILTQREMHNLVAEFRDIVRITLGKKIKPSLIERITYKGGYPYQETLIEKMHDTFDNLRSGLRISIRKEYFLSKIRFFENLRRSTSKVGEGGSEFFSNFIGSTKKFIRDFSRATEETSDNFNLYVKHRINKFGNYFGETADNFNLYVKHRINNFNQRIYEVNRYINDRVRESRFKLTIKRFDNLISKGNRLSFSDTDQAKVMYHTALSTYYTLPIQEQKKYSSLILNLYNNIEAAENEKERIEIERLVSKIEAIKKKHHPMPLRFSLIISNINSVIEKFNEFRKNIAKTERKFISNIGEAGEEVSEKISSIELETIKKFKEGREDILNAFREMFVHLLEVEQKGIHLLAFKERHLMKNLKIIVENSKIELRKEAAKLRKAIKVEVKDVKPGSLKVIKEIKKPELFKEETPIPSPAVVSVAQQINVEPEKPEIFKPQIKQPRNIRRLMKEEEDIMRKIVELGSS